MRTPTSRWRLTRRSCLLACEPPRQPLLTPAHECRDRLAADLLVFVHAELVLVDQVLAPDHVVVAQVDDPQVGIEAGRDAAFTRDAESVCNVRRRECGDPAQLEPALSKEQLPGRLAPGDPAPDLAKVVALLQRQRAGRVVGDDEVHLPEELAISVRAHWGRALCQPAQPLDVRVGVQEVVRASLCGYIPDIGHHSATCCADVNDMYSTASLFAQGHAPLDGPHLGFWWSGIEEVTSGRTSRLQQQRWVLSVN